MAEGATQKVASPTGVVVEEENASSASEYEEIIEEVTDYSDESDKQEESEEAVTAKEYTPDISSPEPAQKVAKPESPKKSTKSFAATETSTTAASVT